jgi:3alpha(or 20beta)-hydroxysteroid dehydrogenase
MPVVVVSGGAQGFGKSIAKHLLSLKDYKVVFCDINEQVGKATEMELGASATFVQADVTKPQDWKRVFEVAKTMDEQGCVDALVNAAGILGPLNQDPAELSFEDLMRVLSINLVGSQQGIKVAMSFFEKKGSGVISKFGSAITDPPPLRSTMIHGNISHRAWHTLLTTVNLSSVASFGTTGSAGIFSAYSMSKAGVDMLTRGVVNLHGTTKNISCYSLNPAFFETPMSHEAVDIPFFKSLGMSTLEEACFILNPLGKLGNPAALGPLIANAIKNQLKYPNGASIGVIPDQTGNAIFTFDGVQMLGQLVKPAPWSYEPMVDDSFVFCDSTGTPLDKKARNDLLSALRVQRKAVLEAMGVNEETTLEKEKM